MNLTDYHSKYLASDLVRRRSSDSSDKLAVAVAGAQVDMNPHQVDAALFAFASPLSKGALLADEVGLGKTIEAGLVISQRWAEGNRRILIIAPSNLRKQWHQELNEKFFIPCTILESKSYNAEIKAANFRPFEPPDSVVICSYQFARNKAADVHATPWDLVVIDEAHRLRNVYKPSNIIANTLKGALAERNKLLLTATPLQNSLLELYGLVSFIDEHTFGDLKSFREQFSNTSHERTFQILKERLKPICHRTLRRQVTAYVPYTKRHAILEEFSPDEAEDRLYNLVTAYLQRDNLQALPSSQRTLMTLVLRKLLASSTFAIAGALSSISNRLQKRLDQSKPASLTEALDEDYEALDETAEEWSDDDIEPLTEADQRALELEIAELDPYTKARELLARFSIQSIPTPLEKIAKHLGAQVRFSPFDDELSGMVYVKNGVPIIGVNSLHHPNRQRFTIAHELGHLELHREMITSSVHVDKNFPVLMRDPKAATGTELIEIQANQFAAELLMPRAKLDEVLASKPFDIDDDGPIEELAKKFRVSKQALEYRIRNR